MFQYAMRLGSVNFLSAPFGWGCCSYERVLLPAFPIAHDQRNAMLKIGYGFLWLVHCLFLGRLRIIISIMSGCIR